MDKYYENEAVHSGEGSQDSSCAEESEHSSDREFLTSSDEADDAGFYAAANRRMRRRGAMSRVGAILSSVQNKLKSLDRPEHSTQGALSILKGLQAGSKGSAVEDSFSSAAEEEEEEEEQQSAAAAAMHRRLKAGQTALEQMRAAERRAKEAAEAARKATAKLPRVPLPRPARVEVPKHTQQLTLRPVGAGTKRAASTDLMQDSFDSTLLAQHTPATAAAAAPPPAPRKTKKPRKSTIIVNEFVMDASQKGLMSFVEMPAISKDPLIRLQLIFSGSLKMKLIDYLTFFEKVYSDLSVTAVRMDAETLKELRGQLGSNSSSVYVNGYLELVGTDKITSTAARVRIPCRVVEGVDEAGNPRKAVETTANVFTNTKKLLAAVKTAKNMGDDIELVWYNASEGAPDVLDAIFVRADDPELEFQKPVPLTAEHDHADASVLREAQLAKREEQDVEMFHMSQAKLRELLSSLHADDMQSIQAQLKRCEDDTHRYSCLTLCGYSDDEYKLSSTKVDVYQAESKSAPGSVEGKKPSVQQRRDMTIVGTSTYSLETARKLLSVSKGSGAVYLYVHAKGCSWLHMELLDAGCSLYSALQDSTSLVAEF